ncbi:MAG: hypothetical protein WCP63_00965 [Cyanobium sp. ELA712]
MSDPPIPVVKDVSMSSWLLITSDSIVGATSVGWCIGGTIGTMEAGMLIEQEHFFSALNTSFAEHPEFLGNAAEGPGTDAVADPDGLTDALLSAAST